MCGICGFTGKPYRVILKKMTGTIFHRGPDEDGYYSDSKINLGVRKLSIIDVETGHQPVHNEDKSIWLVFNGEIYNFIELRKELEKKGHQFYTDHSDSEILVHLYEEYGDHFMHKLNGMFATALWDSREERLLLIRDRMGVKPLFYATINENIIFGSEIKAILNHPDYIRTPNFEALYHYFTFENNPAPLTAFKGIYSVSPGEMLTFSRGNIHTVRWWKIKFGEIEYGHEEAVRRKILLLLENATRLRMRSDVPFGAYLSGGIDSSTVVGLMSRFSDKPIKTFSLGYEDKLMEADIQYARKVSKHIKPSIMNILCPIRN
jgi:asparagine synthase (glutamine-hydrolysing)